MHLVLYIMALVTFKFLPMTQNIIPQGCNKVTNMFSFEIIPQVQEAISIKQTRAKPGSAQQTQFDILQTVLERSHP